MNKRWVLFSAFSITVSIFSFLLIGLFSEGSMAYICTYGVGLGFLLVPFTTLTDKFLRKWRGNRYDR